MAASTSWRAAKTEAREHPGSPLLGMPALNRRAGWRIEMILGAVNLAGKQTLRATVGELHRPIAKFQKAMQRKSVLPAGQKMTDLDTGC